MTLDLTLLAWAAVLGLVQLGGAALAKRQQEPPGWQAGPRDEPAPSYTGLAGRLSRAQGNFMESFPMFAAAILVCHAAGRGGALSAWGAQLYLGGRVLYVPLYAFGVPYVRTLAWLVATAGLALVLVACLLPG